jgi:hypothetical protein
MTGESKTDTINRAVQVYELVEEIMKAGGALYIRPHAEAELERLRIF